MFEELLALGIQAAEYDAHLIKIGDSDQFSSGFVAVNPNSKIPALVDRSSSEAIRVFESGNILFYLAEKFGHFLPKDIVSKTEVMNWLFWLQGSARTSVADLVIFMLTPLKNFEYPINRFTMETKRQLDLLDKRLSQSEFIGGDEYSIADIATWPWYGNLILGRLYNAAEFLDVDAYPHLQYWAKKMDARPAVQRGRIVNRTFGEIWEQVPERHKAADIDTVLALQP